MSNRMDLQLWLLTVEECFWLFKNIYEYYVYVNFLTLSRMAVAGLYIIVLYHIVVRFSQQKEKR